MAVTDLVNSLVRSMCDPIDSLHSKSNLGAIGGEVFGRGVYAGAVIGESVTLLMDVVLTSICGGVAFVFAVMQSRRGFNTFEQLRGRLEVDVMIWNHLLIALNPFNSLFDQHSESFKTVVSDSKEYQQVLSLNAKNYLKLPEGQLLDRRTVFWLGVYFLKMRITGILSSSFCCLRSLVTFGYPLTLEKRKLIENSSAGIASLLALPFDAFSILIREVNPKVAEKKLPQFPSEGTKDPELVTDPVLISAPATGALPSEIQALSDKILKEAKAYCAEQRGGEGTFGLQAQTHTTNFHFFTTHPLAEDSSFLFAYYQQASQALTEEFSKAKRTYFVYNQKETSSWPDLLSINPALEELLNKKMQVALVISFRAIMEMKEIDILAKINNLESLNKYKDYKEMEFFLSKGFYLKDAFRLYVDFYRLYRKEYASAKVQMEEGWRENYNLFCSYFHQNVSIKGVLSSSFFKPDEDMSVVDFQPYDFDWFTRNWRD